MSAPALQRIDSAPLPYLLSVPAPSDAPSPVLCFLHGYDEAAPADVQQALTRNGPLRPGSWPGVLERCIVVAPQLPVAGDLWHCHADAVGQIVTAVQAAHGGDPARTYLTGFSFGGNGVFDLALAEPARWAALWVVDPTRVPGGPVAHPVWLSVGEIARRRTEGFVRALGLRDAGAGPELPPGDRIYLDQGADHVRSAVLAYRDERVYAWLLARQRPLPG